LNSIVVGNVNGEVKKLYSLIDSIQSKKGKFDALFCVGRFFPPDSKGLEELYSEVLRSKEGTPIATHFIDSTGLVGPLMNAKRSAEGLELGRGLHFMGRSGVKLMKGGLRVAYLSGIDFDAISTKSHEAQYFGNYFSSKDLDRIKSDYDLIVKNDPSHREGVDILLTSQWPLGIDAEFLNALPLSELKQLFNNSSSSLSAIVDLIKPRYIYSSQVDVHLKRVPFLFSNGLPSRFVALGSLPGPLKPTDSKQVYIQAIEIEPLSRVAKLEDLAVGTEQDCQKESPFHALLKDKLDLPSRIEAMSQYRIKLGQRIIQMEDEESRRREEHKRKPVIDDSQYLKEERIVYVSGYDRHLAFVDLENYLRKYGQIVRVESKIDNVHSD